MTLRPNHFHHLAKLLELIDRTDLLHRSAYPIPPNIDSLVHLVDLLMRFDWDVDKVIDHCTDKNSGLFWNHYELWEKDFCLKAIIHRLPEELFPARLVEGLESEGYRFAASRKTAS